MRKIKPVSIIKTFLRFLSRLLSLRQKSVIDFQKNCKKERILIISLTHLGDIVLLFPFLYNLRRSYPYAQIDILVKKQVKEVLVYCPHINNIITYNAKWVVSNNKKGEGFIKTLNIIRQLRKNRYNLSFVTHYHIFNNLISWLSGIAFRVGYNDESDDFLNIHFKKEKRIQHAFNLPLNLLRYLGLKIESDELKIYLGPEDIAFAEELCKKLALPNPPYLIGIHPGAGNREKIWSPVKYAEVIRYLIDKYKAHILLFAGKQEAGIAEKITFFLSDYRYGITDLTGKTTLLQMASLMTKCKVILSNDSGPMHIASSLGRPMVALFTAVPEFQSEIWGPLSKDSRVVSVRDNSVGGSLEDIKAEDVIKALDWAISIRR